MDYLEHIVSVFADFANPKKRVFVGYLALAVLIALFWLVILRKGSWRHSLQHIFDRRVFFAPSAWADYKIFVINRLFTFFVSPLLLSQVAIATAIYFALHGVEFLRPGQFQSIPNAVIVGLFTLTLFVIDDLSKYLLHRWMHRFPLLWALHKVHHSATVLTPVTVYRVHPLEGVLYTLRGVVAQGTVIPVFYFLFGEAVSLYTVVGVNILVFVFHVTGSNLRHSHISIRYWPWLEHILISPAQHQLHHSIAVQHFDKNFGAALAVWDWAFGSLHLSEDDREDKLEFGLDASQNSSDAELSKLYLNPFVDMARIVKRRIKMLRAVLARSFRKDLKS